MDAKIEIEQSRPVESNLLGPVVIPIEGVSVFGLFRACRTETLVFSLFVMNYVSPSSPCDKHTEYKHPQQNTTKNYIRKF